MSDAYVQVTVLVPGKPIVGYKIKVKNVYGTINRATNTDQMFLRSIMSGMTKMFGGSAKVESVYHEKAVEKYEEVVAEVDEAPKRRGRPRKVA